MAEPFHIPELVGDFLPHPSVEFGFLVVVAPDGQLFWAGRAHYCPLESLPLGCKIYANEEYLTRLKAKLDEQGHGEPRHGPQHDTPRS